MVFKATLQGCFVFFYVGTESALSLQGELIGRSCAVLCNVAVFLNEEKNMIVYNNLLAKTFLNKKKHYFMIFGCCFTRFKYLEVWEDMELQIHERQYAECFFLALIPALVLSLWLSWWWMMLAFMNYHCFTGWRDGSDIILHLTGKRWSTVAIHYI